MNSALWRVRSDVWRPKALTTKVIKKFLSNYLIYFKYTLSMLLEEKNINKLHNKQIYSCVVVWCGGNYY